MPETDTQQINFPTKYPYKNNEPINMKQSNSNQFEIGTITTKTHNNNNQHNDR